MLKSLLYRRVDNSALVVFRIVFGFLIAFEAWDAIASGWLKRVLIEPQFTFNFIGFDFLQPLPGDWMYVYYAVMGLAGIFVMIGYKYRLNIILYTFMWMAVYFMHKTSYSNYHYLLLLVLILMTIVPANAYKSVDAKINQNIVNYDMPNWVNILFIGQLWIVYLSSALSKIYPDWLDGTVPDIILNLTSNKYPNLEFLKYKTTSYFIGYTGFMFDLFIVPLFLWKKTRMFAFLLCIIFHVSNSILFNIGLFPYLALSMSVFFFSPKFIIDKFLRSKPFYNKSQIIVPSHHKLLTGVFIIWFIFQLFMPQRHWFIKGDVLWTEEGHRLSWRLMLRFNYANTNFKVYDKNSRDTIHINNNDYLTDSQVYLLSKPDGIWQFSQFLKKEYEKNGKDISIFVDSKVSVNGRNYIKFIDEKYDMSKSKWDYFFHNDWIILYD